MTELGVDLARGSAEMLSAQAKRHLRCFDNGSNNMLCDVATTFGAPPVSAFVPKRIQDEYDSGGHPYLETFIDTQDVIMSIGITDGEKGPENKQTVRVSVQMYQCRTADDSAIETCLDNRSDTSSLSKPRTRTWWNLAEDNILFEDPRGPLLLGCKNGCL